VGEAFGEFFGARAADAKKKEDEAVARRNKAALVEVDRVIASDPSAARRLAETNDFKEFFTKAKSTMDLRALDDADVRLSMRQSIGTHLATERREDLRRLFREKGEGVSTDEALSNYIAANTQGMDPDTAGSFAAATQKFGEKDGLAIAEAEHNDLMKTQRFMFKRNMAEGLSAVDQVTPTHAEQAVNELAAGYQSTGVNPIAAKVTAADEFEKFVIDGIKSGKNMDAWTNVEYAGREPMSSRKDQVAVINRAKATALADQLRITSAAEVKSLNRATQSARQAETLLTPDSIRAFRAEIDKTKAAFAHGGLETPQIARLEERYWNLLQGKAKAHTDLTYFINGEQITDRKTVSYLQTPAGINAYANHPGTNVKNVAEARDEIMLRLARQGSTIGFGNETAMRNTGMLINGPPAQQARALRDMLMYANNSNLDGIGRAYTKEAEGIVEYSMSLAAGDDGVLGTPDDPNTQDLIDSYNRTVEFWRKSQGEAAVKPGLAFLTSRLDFSTPQVRAGVDGVMSNMADALGVDINTDSAGLRALAERSLTMAVWEMGPEAPQRGDLKSQDGIIQSAVNKMRRHLQPAYTFDDDSDLDGTQVTLRMGEALPLTQRDFDDVKITMTGLPRTFTEEGFKLEANEFSRFDKGYAVRVKDADGTFRPFLLSGGEEVNLDAGDKDTAFVKQFGVTSSLPAAGGEEGIITVTPPMPKGPNDTMFINDKMYLRAVNRQQWEVRVVTSTPQGALVDAASLEARRRGDFERRKQIEVREHLRESHEAGNISSNAAESAPVDVPPTQAERIAWRETVKSGALHDEVETNFIPQATGKLRGFGLNTATPVTRKRNQAALGREDLVVGFGTNLDRPDIVEVASKAGVDIASVAAGVKALTEPEKQKLAKESLKGSLNFVRKALGTDAMADLGPQRLEALVLLVDTGSFNKSGSDILNSNVVRAIKAKDYDLVADLMGDTLIKMTTDNPREMSDNELRMSAISGRAPAGVATEISRRRQAGEFNPNRADGRKEPIFLESTTVSKARQLAIRAFKTPDPIRPGLVQSHDNIFSEGAMSP
jgi:hypothetical protein